MNNPSADLICKSVPLEIKASDEVAGTFSGYASVFNSLDSDGEIMAPGCFAESLAQHKAKGTFPRLLWQHDTHEPIGVWESIVEDAKGLQVVGRLIVDGVQRAREAYTLLKAKAVDGLSVGFAWRGATWKWDDRREEFTWLSVPLLEISIASLPAVDLARVGDVKHRIGDVKRRSRAHHVISGARDEIDNPRAFEGFLRDAGFSRSEATAITCRGYKMASQGEPDEDGKQRDAVVHQRVSELTRSIYEYGDELKRNSKTSRER